MTSLKNTLPYFLLYLTLILIQGQQMPVASPTSPVGQGLLPTHLQSCPRQAVTQMFPPTAPAPCTGLRWQKLLAAKRCRSVPLVLSQSVETFAVLRDLQKDKQSCVSEKTLCLEQRESRPQKETVQGCGQAW